MKSSNDVPNSYIKSTRLLLSTVRSLKRLAETHRKRRRRVRGERLQLLSFSHLEQKCICSWTSTSSQKAKREAAMNMVVLKGKIKKWLKQPWRRIGKLLLIVWRVTGHSQVNLCLKIWSKVRLTLQDLMGRVTVQKVPLHYNAILMGLFTILLRSIQ